MNYLLQVYRILLLSFISEVLHTLIPLPIPAGIYGIILLLLLLEFKILPMEKVRDVSKFLVEIMPVMFIPACAGVIEVGDILASSIIVYLLVIIVSTMIVMGITGLVTQRIIQIGNKHED